MPPQFEPELWPMIAHRGSVESWHHRDRREVERGLVRAHARHLRREIQRRKERLRDLRPGESVGRKSAQRALHQTDVDAPPTDRAPRRAPKATSSLRGPRAEGVAGRSKPEPRERRLSRGPGLRRSARDDEASEPSDATARARNDGASEPTTDAPARGHDDDAHAVGRSELADIAPPAQPAADRDTAGEPSDAGRETAAALPAVSRTGLFPRPRDEQAAQAASGIGEAGDGRSNHDHDGEDAASGISSATNGGTQTPDARRETAAALPAVSRTGLFPRPRDEQVAQAASGIGEAGGGRSKDDQSCREAEISGNSSAMYGGKQNDAA
ncbi:MAG TPA: hypothetical protein VJY39_02200 [Acidisphaera sp.]|nr:hypothetical protein [Acidisphaera sp.]